jgi:hypothetical protein
VPCPSRLASRGAEDAFQLLGVVTGLDDKFRIAIKQRRMACPKSNTCDSRLLLPCSPKAKRHDKLPTPLRDEPILRHRLYAMCSGAVSSVAFTAIAINSRSVGFQKLPNINFELARDSFAVADAGRLCAELTALFPNDPELDRLDEMVRFALSEGPFPMGVQASTQVFLESIARVVAHGRAHACWERQPHRFLSRDLDFIADLGGVEGWSLAQALNRLALERIEPTRRCAVVGTMRNDGIYILEWVAHYLALGFEHLFIYTNDNVDGSDDLLALLALHGVVTVIESEITGEVPPEAKAFGHALDLLHELRDYEWALFVDSDEFLVPAGRYDNSVPNLLSALAQSFPDGGVAGICYDWLWFVSDMVFERRRGLLCERFQHARPHWLTKCLVRLRDVQSMRCQHHPEVAPGMRVVDSAFEALDIESIFERRQAQYAGGRINHYWPRSFQEFAIKKARGAALGIETNPYDRSFDLFFAWNGYTSTDNFYPTDLKLLHLVKDRIAALSALDGVAAAADRIDRGFPNVLARVADGQQLRRHYARSKVEPSAW